MVLLGVDYGSKKIGLAIGQSITKTANPLKIIKNNNSLVMQTAKIFKEWQPKIVVIGQPKLADGKIHPLEKGIENFIQILKSSYNVAIYREDEALSSFEASQYTNKKEPFDAHAAAIILESWMRCNLTDERKLK